MSAVTASVVGPVPVRDPESEDLSLLRSFEPVVRYTEGELFFPTCVRAYVAQCSLWAGSLAGGRREAESLLVPAGTLTLDELCDVGRSSRDRPLSLRFVQASLDRAAYRQWRREDRPRLRAEGRFTTVGVLARLIDGLLRLSLLVRGRVPGGAVAAAETVARERRHSGRYPYYGRVVRDGGYTVLQYWYFYAFNDWRSTFHGVNDHEADWEMVTVYLTDQADGRTEPAWVAFSSHDYHGDDLRRRWDDPDLHREGDHPVVFAGAGSHSGAFLPGDYVVSVVLPALRRVVRTVQSAQRRLLRWRNDPISSGGFGIPYVDYARGDGLAVGPGQLAEWEPVVINDATEWVRDFRGLWGLDTGDRFGGERAPAGPRYERGGALRTSWSDPLGWAGLSKVCPTDAEVVAHLDLTIAGLTAQLSDLDAEIAAERTALRGLRAQSLSLAAYADTRDLSRARRGELERRERELAARTADRARLAEEREAHRDSVARPPTPEPVQAHLRQRNLPYAEARDARTRFLKIWAALSTPLLILAIVVVLIGPPLAVLTTLAGSALLFAAVEAVARRRLLAFVTGLVATCLALAAAMLVALGLLRHWQTVLAVVLTIGAAVALVINLRELRRGR